MTPAELMLLEWRNPGWLLLALQPVCFAVWLTLRRTHAENYAEAPLRPWALRNVARQTSSAWRRRALYFVWGLFAIAAAGPRLPLGAAESSTPARPFHSGNIMVVLEVSPAMAAQDVAPQRLQRAQLEIQDLLQRLRGERIGLIAFSGNAGVLAPLTDDYAAFAHYLALADFSLFKPTAAHLATALDLAQQTLPQTDESSRAVLLVTGADAEALSGEPGSTALAAAQRLQAASIAFYVLAVSANDVPALQILARTGAGTLEPVRDGDGDWRALYDRGLLALPGESQAPASTQRWLELYPGFLFAALLLLLASAPFARAHGVATVLLAGVFLLVTQSAPVWAAERQYTPAWRAYHDGNFSQAQILFSELQGYDARMGEGAAAYRRKIFAPAIEQFIAALLEANSATQRADALFNLGNAYFQAGQFRAAADAYTDVLRMRAEDPRAQSNLEIATTRLKQARIADPNAAGVLGRRGPQTGGVLGEEIGDRPVMLEPTADDELKRAADAAASGSEHARPRDPLDAGSNAQYRTDDSDRLYRAALKKRELAQDRPADLLREMIKRDTPSSVSPK